MPSSPLLNPQTVQVHFLSNPPSILVFHETSLKVGFFSGPQKYRSFSSLTPSYLLKVTKFLVEISQFEFLVMAEKNILTQTFFVIKYSDFDILIYFYVKIATPAHTE